MVAFWLPQLAPHREWVSDWTTVEVDRVDAGDEPGNPATRRWAPLAH